MQVGPKAVNFDQVRVGDDVTATITQKLVVSPADNQAPSGDGSAAVVARAPKGGQPGALAAETTQATGRIIAIDADKHTGTLQFEDGSTQTFKRADIDPRRYKVGEQFVFRLTEMVVIAVEKP